MTTKTELRSLITSGENSEIEFKRDDLRPHELARELVAFANTYGGKVLLGVDDDGTVSGLTKPDVRDWVTTLCRVNMRPGIDPNIEILHDVENGKSVAIIEVCESADVQSVWRNNKDEYLIRIGSQVRNPSREELSRLFQRRRMIYGEKVIVPDTSIDDLDHRRLMDYYWRVRGQEMPSFNEIEEWTRALRSINVWRDGEITTAGILLFGKTPNMFLQQAGIQATMLAGSEKDYNIVEQTRLRGPMVPLMNESGELIDLGLVEQAQYFVRRNTSTGQILVDGLRREENPAYPEDVIRETIVNALIHRDYFITQADIMLNIYSNRVEIVSPGRLPNGVDMLTIRTGHRSRRNQDLTQIMSDYGYVESLGMGVPRKIIKGMLFHNGIEPEFVETDRDFIVKLYREQH